MPNLRNTTQNSVDFPRKYVRLRVHAGNLLRRFISCILSAMLSWEPAAFFEARLGRGTICTRSANSQALSLWKLRKVTNTKHQKKQLISATFQASNLGQKSRIYIYACKKSILSNWNPIISNSPSILSDFGSSFYLDSTIGSWQQILGGVQKSGHFIHGPWNLTHRNQVILVPNLMDLDSQHVISIFEAQLWDC